MKTMERILSLVLALCMLVSMAPVPTSAAEEEVCTCVAICTDGNTEPQCALCGAEGAVLTDVCRYGDLYIKEAVFSDLFGSPMASWSMVESTHAELQYVVRFYKTGLEAGASPTDTSQGTLAVAYGTQDNYIDVSTKLPAGGNYFYTVYAGYNDNAAVNYENFIGNTVYSKVFTYESSKVALLYSWDGKLLEKEHIQGYEPGTVVTLMTPDETTLKAPAGMEFAGWGMVKDGSIVTHQPGDTITLKEETTVTAQFQEKPWYSVRIVSDGSGGGYPTGGGDFQEGDTVTLSTTLNTEAGFCSMTWNVNDYSFQLPGTIFEPQLTVSFTMPARDVTITADYRSHTYVFENLGDGTHIQQCFMCDDLLAEAVPHVDADGDEACEDCGYSWHVHTLAEGYSYDTEYHWRVCTTCGTSNAIYEAHSFGTDWAHDGESHFYACVCGAVTEVTAHSYTIQGVDENNHWMECVCGAVSGEEAHSGGAATCTAKAKCETCGAEYGGLIAHDYVNQKKDADKHWMECVCGAVTGEEAHTGGAATCTAKAKCETCGAEYGGLIAHDYVNQKKDADKHWMECACGAVTGEEAHTGGTATCTALAECSVCGTTYGDLLTHSYTLQKFDETNHWLECVCGETNSVEAHTGGTATCTDYAVCTECGLEYGDRLAHVYDTQKYDQESHWWECECGHRSNEGAHSGDEPTCDSLGYCHTCGAEYGALLPHDYVNLNSDGLDHWWECACGEKTGVEAHHGGTAACDAHPVCVICGTLYGERLPHNYDTKKFDQEWHWWECECGERFNLGEHYGDEPTCDSQGLCYGCDEYFGTLLPHDYVNLNSDSLDHWLECVCGERVEITPHTGGTATCTAKAKCETCGTEYGTLKAHDYATQKSDAENHWLECVCGKTNSIEAHTGGAATCTALAKCETCGTEYGDLIAHDYVNQKRDADNHWLECVCGEKAGVEAHVSGGAATEDTPEICTECGYVITPALGHIHRYGTEMYDETNHWMECECGAISHTEAHYGGTATCTDYPVCIICGIEYGDKLPHAYETKKFDQERHWWECECGHREAEGQHRGDEPTCDSLGFCYTCGEYFGILLPHDYVNLTGDHLDHWMECVCGEKIDVEAHTGGQATCTALAKCETCGAEYGKLADHVYTTVKSDAENHWMLCACGAASQAEAHSGGNPTCTEQAKCSTCGTAYGDLSIHIYAITWRKDETGHWQECSCGEKTRVTAHTSGGAATQDTPETCTVCGYEIAPALEHIHSYVVQPHDEEAHMSVCECGDVYEIVPHQGGQATCTAPAKCEACGAEYGELGDHAYTRKQDGENHWWECACGHKKDIEAHSGGAATCTALAECEACGGEYGALKAHDYATRKSDADSHWLECVCGEKADAEAHSGGAATCTDKPRCETCGAEYGKAQGHSHTTRNYDENYHWMECHCGHQSATAPHQGGTATCTAKAVCTTCGGEYGDLRNHSHTIQKSDAETHWLECVCGEKTQPEAHTGGAATCTAKAKCETCGAGYGTLLDHDYVNRESDAETHWMECACGHKADIEAHSGGTASCILQARCQICRTSYGELLDHDYVNQKSDKEHHWLECVCGQKSGAEAHVSGGAATQDTPETCTECGYLMAPALGHIHSYDIQKLDETHHWMECECGDKLDTEAHYGGTATCTDYPVCIICGIEYGDRLPHACETKKFDQERHWWECECGHREAEGQHRGDEPTCDSLGFCYTCGEYFGILLPHDYVNLTSDHLEHWMECICGEKTNLEAHSGGQATCTALAECETCGTEYGRLADHAYTTVKSDAETHWMECVCGEKTQPEAHSGGNPTCTEQAKCSTCGTGYGDLAIHIYSITWHSDETNHWQECSCGAKTAEKPHSYGADGTCTTCGYQLEVCTLTIHYADDGFDPGLESKTVTIPYGETVDLSDYWPEQLEYTENGKTWYLAGFTEEPDGFVILSATTMTGDKTLRAVWVTNPQITVTFDPQGGSMDFTKMRRTPSSYIFLIVELVPAPTREGYTFLGWSLTPGGAVADENTKLTADTTLYAVWSEAKTLTLTFPRTGLPDQVYSFAPGTVVDLSDYWPEEMIQQIDGETHYFRTYQTMDHLNLESLTMDTSVTLRAAWRATPQFTVTLDPQGGTLPCKRIRIEQDSGVDRLRTDYPPNSQQGFTFLGWATTPNGAPNQGTVTTDCTLYAIWQENAFTVGNIQYRIETENTVSVQSATLNAGTTILEIPADVVYGGKRYTVASLNASAISTGISTSLTAMLRHVTVYHLGHKPHIGGDFPEGVTVTFVEIWDATPSGLRWNAATKTLAWDALYDSGTTVESRYEATYEVAVYNAQTGMCLSKKTTSTASASFANIFTVTNKQVYFSVTAYDRFGKPSRTVYSNQESLPQTCNDGAPNTATVGGEQVAIRVTDGTAVLDDFVTIGNTVVGVADTGATSIQVGKIATSQAAAQSGQATIQLDHSVTLVIGQSGWQALDEQTGEGQRVNLGAGVLEPTDTQAPKDGDVVMSVNLLRTSAPSLDMADLIKLGVAGNYDSDITFAELKLLAVRALSDGDLRRIARNLSNAWLVTWCSQQADRAETADKLYCMIPRIWLLTHLDLDNDQEAYVNSLLLDPASGKVKLEVHMIKELRLNIEQLQTLYLSDAVSGEFKAWLEEAIAGEPGSTVNVLGGLDVNYTVGGSPVTITGGDFQYGMNLTLPDGVNPSQVSGCRVNEDGTLSAREVILTLLSGNRYKGVIQSDGNSTYIFVCESTVNLPPIPEHTHSYSIQKHDNNYHWMECECGDKQTAELHQGGTATCTAKPKCETCGTAYGEANGHSHTTRKHDAESHWMECTCGDKKDIEAHKGGEATCTEKAKCETCGAEYGEANGHSHTTQKYDAESHWLECHCGDKKNIEAHQGGEATCTEKAKCETCGTAYGTANGHTHTTQKHDAESHWLECHCGDKKDIEVHKGGEATCTEKAKCETCGAEYGEANGHSHTTQKYDAESHWMECACGDKKNIEAHQGGEATCTAKPKCETCGTLYGQPKGHTYSTQKHDAESHWLECACGDKKNIEAHQGGEATCTAKPKCETCGTAYGEANGHTHTTQKHNAESHWLECHCGDKKDVTSHSGGEATCTEKAKCETCGTAYGKALGHISGGAATEDKPEICTRCGQELAPALGHTHSYTLTKSDADTHWQECACGEKSDAAPHSGGTATCTAKAKCTVCGAEYGEAKGHGDTQRRGEQAASCTREGYTGDLHCTDCGAVLETGTAIPMTGHTFVWVTDREATTTQPGLKHEECACGARRSENTLIPQLTSPPTGDTSGILLWITLAVLSGLAILWLLLKKRKSPR